MTPTAPSRPARVVALDALAPAAVVVAVVALFVAPYAVHTLSAPIGWDSAGYAWRTTFALTRGIAHLPTSLPAPGPTNPGRPGFVVIAGLFSSVLRTSPLTMTAVMPAVAASATGLAAGALASDGLRASRWVSTAVALGVGTSVYMVHIVNVEGYQDGAIEAAVVMATFVAVILAAGTTRAMPAAIVLAGAAGVIHWELFQVVAAVLLVTALAYVPAAILQWKREHRVPVDSTSTRLVLVAAGGAAIAALWILVALSAPLPRAELVAGQLAGKIQRDLPALWPWATLPLAAIGAAIVASRASDGSVTAARRRLFLVIALSWSEITLVAFVAQARFQRALPTHRLLAFDLAVPILAVVAMCWGAHGLAGARRGNRVQARAGDAAVVVVLLASALFAGRQWLTFQPVLHPGLVREAAEAGAALDRADVPWYEPVVFVIEDRSPDPWSRVWLLAHTIRAGLPPERLRHAYFSVAPPGHPFTSPASPPGAPSGPSDGGSASTSAGTPFWEYARDVRTVIASDPVVFITASSNPGFDRWVQMHPQSLVAPGLAVVRGAYRVAPLQVSDLPTTGRISAVHLAGLSAASLSILFVVGLAWRPLLFGGALSARAGILVAPAVGMAVIVLGGILLNAVGLPMRGPGAWASLLLLTAGGPIVLFLGGLAGSRRRSARDPVPIGPV